VIALQERHGDIQQARRPVRLSQERREGGELIRRARIGVRLSRQGGVRQASGSLEPLQLDQQPHFGMRQPDACPRPRVECASLADPVERLGHAHGAAPRPGQLLEVRGHGRERGGRTGIRLGPPTRDLGQRQSVALECGLEREGFVHHSSPHLGRPVWHEREGVGRERRERPKLPGIRRDRPPAAPASPLDEKNLPQALRDGSGEERRHGQTPAIRLAGCVIAGAKAPAGRARRIAPDGVIAEAALRQSEPRGEIG